MAGLAAGILLLSGPASADVGADIADAFTAGKVNLSLRYRYEFVDQDGFSKDANASTLRTRLGYNSADYQDFSVILMLEDIRPVGEDNYNSTRNGVTDRPVVVDPKGTDVRLAALKYRGLKNTEIVLGRQLIKRANERFIGSITWRQNDQTFDALSIAYNPLDNLKLSYSYIDRVKRIFGPDDPAAPGGPVANFSSSSHLLDGSYNASDALNVNAYAYFLDLGDDPQGAANSNQTYGLRLTGTMPVRDIKLGYVAEYAYQEDYEDNPVDYDAGYYVLEGTANWSKFGVKLGYEVLEADGGAGAAFQTSLGTNHKFNGWADKFLVTPAGGLEDLYIAANANVLGGKMSLVYHDFSRETGGGDYGDEFDFVANWNFGKHYSVLGKFALYSEDSFATDTDKFWLMLTAAF